MLPQSDTHVVLRSYPALELTRRHHFTGTRRSRKLAQVTAWRSTKRSGMIRLSNHQGIRINPSLLRLLFYFREATAGKWIKNDAKGKKFVPSWASVKSEVPDEWIQPRECVSALALPFPGSESQEMFLFSQFLHSQGQGGRNRSIR